MNNDNYVVINGWMCNELNLKGNELLVFALIYGFSQDGVSEFKGSRNYIGNTFNISLPTVDKALKALVDKELLIKRTESSMCVDFNYYRINLQVVKKLYRGSKETLYPYKETLQGGSKETLYNKYNNISINKNTKKNKTRTDRYLDSILAKLEEYDFSDKSKEKILEFYEMWASNKVLHPLETVEKQLTLLANETEDAQISSINKSITNGWKSPIYESSKNVSKNGFEDSAKQDFKSQDIQRNNIKGKGVEF